VNLDNRSGQHNITGDGDTSLDTINQNHKPLTFFFIFYPSFLKKIIWMHPQIIDFNVTRLFQTCFL